MHIKPIKTEKDYQAAMSRMKIVFDALPNTPEGDESEVLAILIEKYEEEHYPIEDPDPIEAIKFRMEQMGYNQSVLAAAIGSASRASEVLNRKRKLTLPMIYQIHKAMNISIEMLVRGSVKTAIESYNQKGKPVKAISKSSPAYNLPK